MDQSVPFSKAKWKKKRFLMLQDIMSHMDRGDFDKASRKAGEAIRRMKSLYEQTGHAEYLPNLQAYNVWIHSLAKRTTHPIAGQLAEAVLREMQQQQQQRLQQPLHTAIGTRSTNVRPSVVTYTSVMDAYANQGHANDAERILMELLSECDCRRDILVTSITCDTVLNAWASQGTWEGAARAEEILKRLELLQTGTIQPTPHSYATVIHAWASCRGGVDAALRAQDILTSLLMQGSIEPDTVIFNSVMHAWSNSGDKQAGVKSSAILNQMQDLHLKKGYDCRPDIVSYNTVLAAWSHSGHEQAGTRAEKMLQDMLVAYRASPSTAVAPNTVSYNSVLHAWSNSPLDGAASRAESVLNFMLAVQDSQANRLLDGSMMIEPDVYSFTSVLNAIAKSKEPDKADRAHTWLLRLLERRRTSSTTKQPPIRLNQVPFNTVINACAFSAIGTSDDQRARALEISAQTLSDLREHSLRPDAVTYYNMIKCVANLLASSRRRREDAIVELLESCAADGLVTGSIWIQVCKAVSPQRLQETFPRLLSDLKYRDLPRSWTYSVPSAKRSPPTRKNSEPVRRRRAGPPSPTSVSEPSYQSGRDL